MAISTLFNDRYEQILSTYVHRFNKYSSAGAAHIPNNTIVKVRMRPLMLESDMTSVIHADTPYLRFGFYVVEGPYKGFCFDEVFVVGTEEESDSCLVRRSLGILKSIIESVRNINPFDRTPNAMKMRKIQSFAEFDELEFPVIVGVRELKDPALPRIEYKNYIKLVITPAFGKYHTLMQSEKNKSNRPNK